MLLKDLIASYVAAIKDDQRYAKTTIKTYNNRLRMFRDWSGEETTLSDFADSQRIEAYKAHRKTADSICDTTLGSHLCALRAFGGWLVECGLLAENPALAVKKPKRSTPVRHYMSDQEVWDCLCACDRFADDYRAALAKAVFCTYVYTGLRRNEVLSLRMCDYHAAERRLWCAKGKGKKSRAIYPAAEYFPILEKYLALRPADAIHDFIFAIDRSRRLADNGLRALLNDIKAIAGYKGAVNINTHPVRRNFCNHLIHSGADILDVQAAMGHDHLETTIIYTKTDDERLRRIADLGSRRAAPLAAPEPTPQDATAQQNAPLIAELLRQMQMLTGQPPAAPTASAKKGRFTGSVKLRESPQK